MTIIEYKEKWLISTSSIINLAILFNIVSSHRSAYIFFAAFFSFFAPISISLMKNVKELLITSHQYADIFFCVIFFSFALLKWILKYFLIEMFLRYFSLFFANLLLLKKNTEEVTETIIESFKLGGDRLSP